MAAGMREQRAGAFWGVPDDRAQVSADDARDAMISALFDTHYGQLTRIAYLMTGDGAHAEEIVQEAFVRAWRNWSRIDEHAAAPRYLRVTVVNLARNLQRRRALELRHLLRVSEDAPQQDPGVRLDVERALRRLPARKRACVVLRHYAGLTEQETADLLGISVGTVKSQTAKGLAQLKDHLSQAAAEGKEARDAAR
jgi:RNA polymerase sigma-70 factor (sigma-E family)